MDLALLLPTPGTVPVPWQRLSVDHRAAFLRDLVGPECVGDIVSGVRVTGIWRENDGNMTGI